MKKIQTELTEDHLARTDSTADTVRCPGLFRFQLVMPTQVQHGYQLLHLWRIIRLNNNTTFSCLIHQ